MRRVRLLVLAAMAMFAFGALSAAVASAEEPLILVLEGKATDLEGTFSGGASSLSTLAGKELTGTKVTSPLKGCSKIEGKEKDINLCNNITITFTGVKQGAVNCRSEMADGTQKDEIGTVLVVVDLHLASGETTAKTLVPLALFKVLGALASETGEELTINCGGVKNKVKGVIPCELSPGLTNIPTTKATVISCKLSKTHDQEVAKCEVLCEWLKEHPFESNLGAGFEDAGMALTAESKLNKDIFIDD